MYWTCWSRFRLRSHRWRSAFSCCSCWGREGPFGTAARALFGSDIIFTWFAAAIAGAVVSFPLVTRSIMVAMGGVDRRLELSARTLGAGPWRVFFTITVPLAYRGILAGLLLGFVRALSEFGATIVVAGNIAGRTETLPLAVYSNILLGRDGQALKLIGITIGLAVLTLAVHNWLLARMGGAREGPHGARS